MQHKHGSHNFRLFLFAVLVILAAVVTSHQLIYKLLVIPRLPTWAAIPVPWRLLLYGPMIAAVILIGIKISTISQFLTVVLASALVTEFSFFVFDKLNEPGFRQQPIDGGVFFTVRFLVQLAGFAVVFAVVWLISHFVRKRLRQKAAAAPNNRQNDARTPHSQ